MLRLVSRLLRTEPVPYARKVATALLHEGFDLKSLDEMRTLGSFDAHSVIFKVLAAYKLRPADAAEAILLASHLYRTTRATAEAQGWPLGDGQGEQYPRHEAYFLELLEEAARILKQR